MELSSGRIPSKWTWALAALLAVVQVVHELLNSSDVAWSYTESYYLITYRQGFVRRGLIGEVLHLAVGVPTVTEVVVVADFVSSVAVLSVVFLIVLLLGRRTARCNAFAILLAASPFTFNYIIMMRRPDQLPIAVLVVLGVALLKGGDKLDWWVSGAGIAFGILVLCDESICLVQIPWAAVLVVTSTVTANRAVGRSKVVRRVSELLAAPAIALGAVIAFGLPGAAQVSKLREDVSGIPLSGVTNFTYLGDTLRQGIEIVRDQSHSTLVHSAALGAFLLLIQIAWVVLWCGFPAIRPLRRIEHIASVFSCSALLIASTMILFITGYDWLRWFADIGCSALVVGSFAILIYDDPSRRQHHVYRGALSDGVLDDAAFGESALGGGVRGDGARGGTRPEVRDSGVRVGAGLPVLLVVVAIYLALVPPLMVLIEPGQLKHYLFLF